MTSGKAEASVLMTNPTGLHARPAVKFSKLAKTFRASVQVRPGGQAPTGWTPRASSK